MFTELKCNNTFFYKESVLDYWIHIQLSEVEAFAINSSTKKKLVNLKNKEALSHFIGRENY